jgi:hypothetical protein
MPLMNLGTYKIPFLIFFSIIMNLETYINLHHLLQPKHLNKKPRKPHTRIKFHFNFRTSSYEHIQPSMLCRITSPEKSQKSNPFFLRFQNTNTSLSTKKQKPKNQNQKPKKSKHQEERKQTAVIGENKNYQIR